MTKPRIAVVVSHPIQHFCPQYASWSESEEWDLQVFFASTAGMEAYQDENFGQEIKWEGLELNFPHVFLNDGEAISPSPSLDAPELETRLAAYGPDVVIVYGYIQKLQRRALRWGSKHCQRVLMISDSEDRTERPMYKEALKKLALPKLFEQVDGFLTVGDANEDYYRAYGVPPQQFFRTFFPIDRDYFQKAFESRAEMRSELRAEYGIPNDHMVVSVVGKLVDWKRQQDLIHAQQILRRNHPKTTTLIIGSGPTEDELREMVDRSQAEGVIFTGFVQPTELPKFYAATDVYVHTASHEPHSLAISEAIFMGCAAVISDRCGSYGPTDDVRPGHNGFVYECGEPEALSQKLAVLAANPEMCAEFGGASRRFAQFHQELAHGGSLRAALRAVGVL
ncbi:glycosyltransferase family 4 protein [Persicimonas caeni]|uniref:Glycosyltransferase family 4 protein n=1 Tax=Persicimonas caeni TaxID=2292766 RepID=A0A4Y6PTP7_PERCE|nr:glycosyltransferase family 4 protein [Persicimonas caeni]QDG51691.1 glycosyltransferase family 4 protein [Persicimonas caeni]QED32912.1 glycosyltransferase family 4 protein [Persicimonas caeni]